MAQHLELIDALNEIESEFQLEKERTLQSYHQKLTQEKTDLQSHISEMQTQIKQIITEIRQYTVGDVAQLDPIKPQRKPTIPKQSLARFHKLVGEILTSSS